MAALCNLRPAPCTQAGALLALALFQVHLVRRLLETTLLMRYPRGAKMHVVAYAFGLSYYAAVPLSLLPPAALAAPASMRAVVEAVAAAVSHPVRGQQWAAVGRLAAGATH